MLRDLTCVLFDQKLIVQLMNQHSCQHTLTVQQCRILLTDIACCSLMRLDMTSMDKLWDLMVMLCKWQLTMIRDTPSRLLELTFRHMDGVAKLMPEMKKTLLVDTTKRCLIDFWEACADDDMLDILVSLIEWMAPFNIKISILIRSGLQLNDGTFETATEQMHAEYVRDHLENIGENIYARNANAAKNKPLPMVKQPEEQRNEAVSNELSTLASQLNIDNDIVDEAPDPSDEATAVGGADGGQVSTSHADDKNDVDGVNCSVSTEHVKHDENDANGSEFVYLKKATSALQGYLEQFAMENVKAGTGRSSSAGDPNSDDAKTFDATEELLKLLEDKDNGAK